MRHKVIKKVLMCKPLYFSSLNYLINPWMKPGQIDKRKCLKEWSDLVKIYKELGIKVEILDQKPEVPDMVFTADQGIVDGKLVLISRFKHRQRQRETKYYEDWFYKNGFKLKYLPKDIFFEGNGELFFWNNLIFLGTGYRSDKRATSIVSKLFGKAVIDLEVVDPAFYHLDVGFFPLNSSTIFYYPKAYSLRSQKKLKKLVPNLIEFTKNEALGFCGNSVVTDHHVIYQKGNLSFENKLSKLGYDALPIELSQFIKSGGGAHCLTNTLEEAYES